MPATAKEEDVTDNASSRRMRKRELDRRCQRVARERTKNRIAYLEGLVDDFRKSDSSGQVTTLMNQLSDIAKERDTLARTLQGIQNSIQAHQSLIKGETTGTSDKNSSDSPTHSNDNFERFDDETAVDPATNFSPHPGEKSPSPTSPIDMRLPYKFEDTQNEPLLVPRHALPLHTRNVDAFDPGKVFINDDAAENHGIPQGSIISRIEEGCECSANTAAGGKQAFNTWRFANEVLTKPTTMNADLERFEDVMEEDAPVRALIEGWPAVERMYGGVLPPTWTKLRQIDEVMFGNCNVRERLAILRLTHKLMRFHINKEKKSMVPAWYLNRPSQTIAHSYAIDYVVWPGLRERFVFYHHNYCSEIFWQLLRKSLRILWPFEFRDCYTRNLETGQYQISRQFDDRVGDINAWTMSNEIFKKWPEFYSDIPAYNHIPSSVSNTMTRMLPQARRPTLLEGVIDERRDEARQEEISPIFLEPWNTGLQYVPVPAKGTDFIGVPQYLDYSGLSNVNF